MKGLKKHTVSNDESTEFYGDNSLVYSVLKTPDHIGELALLKTAVNALNKKGIVVNISISYEN